MHVPEPTGLPSAFLGIISVSQFSDDLKRRLTNALAADLKIWQVEFVPEDAEDTILVRTSQPLGAMERMEAVGFVEGFKAGFCVHLTP